jgi:hypothetical protein
MIIPGSMKRNPNVISVQYNNNTRLKEKKFQNNPVKLFAPRIGIVYKEANHRLEMPLIRRKK